MRQRQLLHFLSFFLFLGILSFAATPRVFAATITVTNGNDSGAGSLRAAIAAATAGDTIDFDAAVTQVNITSSSAAPNGFIAGLIIDKNLTIDGGATGVTINRNVTPVTAAPIFTVISINTGVTLTMTGINITNGRYLTGGGIWINGTLNFSNGIIRGNSATAGSGGGAYLHTGAVAIFNNTLFRNNAGPGAAIGNAGTLTLNNSTLSDNTDGSSTQGALFNAVTATLNNTIIANSSGGDCRGTGSMTANYSLVEGVTNNCGVTGGTNLNGDPNLNTTTFQLNTGSIAIDAGNPAAVGSPPACLPTDLNGTARPIGGACDIGAYEFAPAQTITVAFDSAASSSPEASGFGNLLRVTTSNSAATASAVTLTISATGGTATGADYSVTGTVTIPAGTAHNSLVSIASGATVTDENLVEPDETVNLQISAPSGASLGAQTTTTHTISNDDSSAVTIADVSNNEGNAGTTSFTFTATLGNPVQGGFTVNFASANGSATTADNDYAAASGTLTFAGTAGETQSFTVVVNGDTAVEPSEDFSVSMNTSSNSNVDVTDTATGNITNDDVSAVMISDVTNAEGNAGTTSYTFTATLSNAVAGGFTVNFASSDGSATTADNDYLAASGTLTFAGTAGETQSFTVTVNGDTTVEPNEDFNISMNTVSNAGVNITDTALGTIMDDDAGSGTGSGTGSGSGSGSGSSSGGSGSSSSGGGSGGSGSDAWDIQITSDSVILANGQRITFTITIRKLLGGTPVQVNFPLSDSFDIVSASSNRGTVAVSGQRVTYTDDVHVGDVGIVTVVTVVNSKPPRGIEEACISVPISKCATVLFAVQLPSTGETPFWRNSLLLSFVAIFTITILLAGWWIGARKSSASLKH